MRSGPRLDDLVESYKWCFLECIRLSFIREPPAVVLLLAILFKYSRFIAKKFMR